MHRFRAARLIAGVDLRRRLRNRSFLIQGIVGPIALAGIISLAFGGGDSFEMTLGVVDADGSALGQGIVTALTGPDADGDAGDSGLTFEAVDAVGEARRLVQDGDLDAAVVVPEGFAASLGQQVDEPRPVQVLADGDGEVAADVARAVAGEITARANAGRLAVATATALDVPVPEPGTLAAVDLPVTVDTTGTGGDMSPAAYFGPSMGLLFLLLTVGTIARDLLAEKRTGTIDRVRAGPVGAAAIIAGKGMAVVAVSITSLLVIWVATAVLMGADWGDPRGVVLLILAGSLAVAGVAGLIAAVARTEQAAENLATAVAFVFALLGGAFMPPGMLPDTLARFAVLTPVGWALRGFAELSAGRGDVGDVVTPVGVLLLWAVVTAGLAARLLPARLGAR